MTILLNNWHRFLQQVLLLVLLGFTADAFTQPLPDGVEDARSTTQQMDCRQLIFKP